MEMKQNEVLEFVVVPPYHRRHAIAAAERQFADFLQRRFRGYQFRIAGIAPVGDPDDEGFHVLPIMNYVDPDGVERMCAPPQAWLLSEIASVCSDFDPARSRH
jgi:hypothetical protein